MQDVQQISQGKYTPSMAALLPSVQSLHVKSKQIGAASTTTQKSSSVSVDTLYSELKGISIKWHKLGSVLKIGQLEEIRVSNRNDPD